MWSGFRPMWRCLRRSAGRCKEGEINPNVVDLIGFCSKNPEDVVHPAKQKSWVERQMRLEL